MKTVVCVCRTGKFLYDFSYSQDHVDTLREGVSRYLPHDRFVCLTDAEMPGVDTIPLQTDWPGWWAKLELFLHDFSGPAIYLDLDVTLNKPVEFLWGFSAKLTGYGSAVMVWDGAPIPEITDRIDPKKTFDEFTRRGGKWGDQDFIWSVHKWRCLKRMMPSLVLDFPDRHEPEFAARFPIWNSCGRKKPWGQFGVTEDGKQMQANPPVCRKGQHDSVQRDRKGRPIKPAWNPTTDLPNW